MGTETNRQWLLARRPRGEVCAEDFRWNETLLPETAENEILVRNLYLSCDATQRVWMSAGTYMPAVKIGEVMRSFAVGEVIESRHGAFRQGQLVYGLLGWQDFCSGPPSALFSLLDVPRGVPLVAALGVLGLNGLTAYFGLTAVGAVRAKETVLVSSAAGATGSIAGKKEEKRRV